MVAIILDKPQAYSNEVHFFLFSQDFRGSCPSRITGSIEIREEGTTRKSKDGRAMLLGERSREELAKVEEEAISVCIDAPLIKITIASTIMFPALALADYIECTKYKGTPPPSSSSSLSSRSSLLQSCLKS